MANNKPVPPRPTPRLYLATPVVADPAELAASLASALAAADVAAVLLRLAPVDQRTMITRAKTLAPVIQAGGAAALLDGQSLGGQLELVARSGADGAHVTGIAAMEDALPSLKPDRIIGVGGLATRHDSMAAGEAGADYVLFGERDAKGAAALDRGDRRTPAMVGRTVRAALRRLRRIAGRGAGIRRRRRGFRSGRRFHLGRSARCGGGAVGGRADDARGVRAVVR
jgi:hypothetical protein